MTDDTFSIYMQIPAVELHVAAARPSTVIVEKYDSASRLMHRLDILGRKQQKIKAITEGGQEMPAVHVEALNLYLQANRGLRSFRRVAAAPVFTKYGWSEFREKLNIPTLAVLVSV